MWKKSPKWLFPYIRSVYLNYLRIKNIINTHSDVSKIITYYSSYNKTDPEIQSIIKTIKKYGIITYPYEWVLKPVPNEIDVYFDENKNLHYTLLDGKRLYYPRNYTIKTIQGLDNGLQNIQQNIRSPHRYLTQDFNVNNDDIVIDCGVAEGNFSLSVIDKVKKVYLFEPEDKWIEPLKATFEPWMDKTVIIQKFVSDISDEYAVTLDSFFEDKEKPTFLKMDVDGYEKKVLMGGKFAF